MSRRPAVTDVQAMVGEIVATQQAQGDMLADILRIVTELRDKPLAAVKDRVPAAVVGDDREKVMYWEALAQINTGVPMTATEIQHALDNLDVCSLALQRSGSLRKYLLDQKWIAPPKNPTRINGKMGRYWTPPPLKKEA